MVEKLKRKPQHPPARRRPPKHREKERIAQEHEQGMTIMQPLRLHEPRIPQPQKTHTARTFPTQPPELVALANVFNQVRDDHDHKNGHCQFVKAIGYLVDGWKIHGSKPNLVLLWKEHSLFEQVLGYFHFFPIF